MVSRIAVPGAGSPARNSPRTTGLTTYFAVPLASLRFSSRRCGTVDNLHPERHCVAAKAGRKTRVWQRASPMGAAGFEPSDLSRVKLVSRPDSGTEAAGLRE